jgi:hypothetical protein
LENYEKLGVFYLGKLFNRASRQPGEGLLLYDSRDLTTHAVCVGMTGSGKTGLCISLLEEAAIDGIPAIVIDPKGDLGNLMLTFPDLKPADFQPWIDEGEASREGISLEDKAVATAEFWRKGLAEWGQDPSRIRKFKEAVEPHIYTPGSQFGIPISVLRSFEAPPPQIRENTEYTNDRILSAVSGLLGLLNIDADPIRSREHILLSRILESAWKQGQNLDLVAIIQQIQKPPFQKVGVFDLESFFPSKERFELAIMLNNLIASPSFSSWIVGEPLDIQRFLYTPEGKPRLSIFSIAHLSDAERMFFVTILLNEMLSWVRSQPGTSSLRALLYIDEIYGYFPPVANPPSKTPMLTLLKQARAFGVGVVLATQNPVDLDYKGLSNAGTWFIGRLQTERDRDRLLDGIQSLGSGQSVDRKEMESLISGLEKRVFFMNNVHDNRPELFQTRWALSYLRGPLTLPQIRTLMAPVRAEMDMHNPDSGKKPKPESGSEHQIAGFPVPSMARPVMPPGIEEAFLQPKTVFPADSGLVYRPYLGARVKLHFTDSGLNLDVWQDRLLAAPFMRGSDVDWPDALVFIDREPVLEKTAPENAGFEGLPAGIGDKQNYSLWEKMLKSHLYQSAGFELFSCPSVGAASRPGETEGDFVARMSLNLREKRDLELEKLKQKYAPRLAALEGKIRSAQARVDVEKSQVTAQTLQTVISVGATVLGALFGRKVASTGNIGRATTAMRGAGRISREKEDVQRAKQEVQALQGQMTTLQQEFEQETLRMQEKLDVGRPVVEKIKVNPRKNDILVRSLVLIWTPWLRASGDRIDPAF